MSGYSRERLHEALKHFFGYDEFRLTQLPVIENVLRGADTLAIMPTGAGKSICYQLPAMLLPGITIVVSPLIALMKDQVDALLANGIYAAFLNSTQSPEEQGRIIQDAHAGKRLQTGVFKIGCAKKTIPQYTRNSIDRKR